MPKPRLVVDLPPAKLRPPRSQSQLDRDTLLMQLRHDCRDLALALEVLEVKPELLQRPQLTRVISIEVDGFLSRLRSFRKLLP